MSGKPVAKEGDQVVGNDTHIVMVVTPTGPVPTPMPFPFAGKFREKLSETVFIDGKAVALEGSIAKNEPEHMPMGGMFQKQPTNEAKVERASAVLLLDGRGVVRAGDIATTCNDPVDLPTGTVIAEGTVILGD